MFVSKNQIFIFFSCLAFGGVFSVIFSLSDIIKRFIKKEILKIIPDLFAFIIFSLLYIVFSYILHFPSLRLYMIIGVFVGIILYFKSFKIMLANLEKKAYNIYRKKIKRRKTKDDSIKS